MGFGLREWMILIGGLLIIVVIVDGVRRMLADRRHHMRMGMSYDGEGGYEEGDYEESDRDPLDEGDDDNPELPNGGARTLNRNEPAVSEPVIGSLELDVERLSGGDFPESAPPVRRQPERPLAARLQPDKPDKPAKPERPPRERLKMPSFKRTAVAEPVAAEELSTAVVAEESDALEVAESISGSDANCAQIDPLDDGVEASPELDKPAMRDQPEEVLVINVLSRDNNGFNGSDLLEVLLACDVRFGEMNIFHRYEDSQGNGPIQFSVANLVKPGTFDLTMIKEFYTPGVTFFMQLPGPSDPMAAFDCMAEIASCIVRNLQGEMRDEGHSVLTQQTLEHYRQRIRDYERMCLTRVNRKA
jgi:cell division protein ZipA